MAFVKWTALDLLKLKKVLPVAVIRLENVVCCKFLWHAKGFRVWAILNALKSLASRYSQVTTSLCEFPIRVAKFETFLCCQIFMELLQLKDFNCNNLEQI